jgi:hypothetical protein
MWGKMMQNVTNACLKINQKGKNRCHEPGGTRPASDRTRGLAIDAAHRYRAYLFMHNKSIMITSTAGKLINRGNTILCGVFDCTHL